MGADLERVYIERCKNGDSGAFGPLMNIFRPQLFSYLKRISGDQTLAEDLLQETFIKVWRGIKNYNEQNKFSSWLFSIAHNAAMDELRKKKRNNIIYSDELPENHSAPNIELEIITDELKEMIDKAVDRLPIKQKRVFLLRQYGKIKFKEIAEITEDPLNTVLAHMNYATKKIKNELRRKNAI